MMWLGLAWRNVVRNRRRSGFSVVIICCGTVALLLGIGFVQASFHSLREAIIHGESGHIQIGAHGQFNATEERPLQYGLGAAQLKEVEKRIDQDPAVRFVTRRILFEGLISNGQRSVGFIGQGIQPDKEAYLSIGASSMVAGEGFTKGHPGQDQILVAADLAEFLNLRPLDTVTVIATTADGALNAIDAIVAGTYRTGVPDLDRRAIMMPLPSVQSLLDTDKISRLVVALHDTEMTDRSASRLIAELPDLDIKKWIELAPFYGQVVTLYQIIFSVLGIIIAALVLISTTNSMLMSLMERIREIGTLRAIGIPDSQVGKLFLLEGGMIGMLGASAGIVLAVTLAWAINFSDIRMPPPPGRTTDYQLIIFAHANSSFFAWIFFICLGAVAAWLPVRLTSRMSILKKLNHV